LEEKLKQAEERLNAQDAEIEMLKKFIAFLPNTCKKANKFFVINEFINNDQTRRFRKSKSKFKKIGYRQITQKHLINQ
jgi:hypothetical protein